jgi:hypothetical protein
MARQLWVVLVEDFDVLYPSDYYRNQYIHDGKDNHIMSVFTSKRDANEAAQLLASRYPGKDIHVFAQQHGYTSAPRPVESKVWTADGKFIPGTPEA